VDANDARCPTFQQRVDFECEGPATWRGGYNSGKTNSINHPFLDLECGINRVSIRAGLTPGAITIHAKSEGLKPTAVIIKSTRLAMENGFAKQLPEMQKVSLPETVPSWTLLATAPVPKNTGATQAASAGKFIRTFSYSGPTAIVHVEANAQAGKNIYVDRDLQFSGLPDFLSGADWVQAAQGDSSYSAVDLMEFSVPAGATVYVAYDGGKSPEWLNDFNPVKRTLLVNDRPMILLKQTVSADRSFTFGSNFVDNKPGDRRMYVVFVKGN